MSDDAHHEEHTPEHYNKIAKILVIAAVISYLGPMVAEHLPKHFGFVMTMITAFGIAFYKAFLVCKHFMHLNVEKRYVVYLLTTALAFMLLFYAGVAPDVMRHRGRQWENVAAQQEIKRATDAIAAAHGGQHGEHGEDAEKEGHGEAH